MWAIWLFPWGLTAVSLLLQPGLDAGATIANVAADAVAARAFTAMTPAVESVNRDPSIVERSAIVISRSSAQTAGGDLLQPPQPDSERRS